jgi:hypothetical protein
MNNRSIIPEVSEVPKKGMTLIINFSPEMSERG